MLPGAVSFVLGALWQSWRASSSEVASQLNDLLKEVKALEELSTEYWVSDATNEKESELTVRLRGASFAIAAFEAQIDLLFHQRASSYRNSVDTLIITCTGGTFETAERTSDASRAIEVRQIAAEVASLIRMSRQESAGLVAIIWEVVRVTKKIPVWFMNSLDQVCDAALKPVAMLRKAYRKFVSAIPPFF